MAKGIFFILFMVLGCEYGSPGTGADGCRGYPDPLDSPYLLPFPVGASYEVTQAGCGFTHRGQNRFAYDFRTNRGDVLTAMRAGVVKAVQDSSKDGKVEYSANSVEIEHEDGTIAYYAHIKSGSTLVSVGDIVSARESIAEAGTVSTHVVVDVLPPLNRKRF